MTVTAVRIDPHRLTMTIEAEFDASPERVWPWLAQMGAGRAGWYAYDRVDNGGAPSAPRLMPECQDVAPGDILPAVPGATDVFVVAAVDPPRDLVLTVPLTPASSRSRMAVAMIESAKIEPQSP